MVRGISESKLFWGVAAVVTLVQAATLDATPDWYGDDYASYIHNAQSLLSGGAYALSGYMPDLAVDAGPAAYPPGLPLLLMAPIGVFGVDFTAICVLNAIGIGLFARLFAAWLRPAAPTWLAAAAALLVGLSPFFLAFKNVVASEFLFLVLLLGWLLVDRRMAGGARYRAAVLAGLLLGAALLTRLAGLPALAAGPLAELVRRRRLSVPGLLAPVIAALLLAGGLWLVTPDLVRHYLANVGANAQGGGVGAMLGQIMGNLASLPGRLSALWSYAGQGAQPALPLWLGLLRKAATLLLLGGGFVGLFLRLRQGARGAEVFFLLMLAALLVLPEIMAGPRLFLPLSVLIVGYVLDAAGAFRRPVPAQIVVLAVLLVGSGASWIAMARAPDNPYRATEPRAEALFHWLRAVPEPGEVVLARRARAVVFFTGHPASDWHQTKADAGFLAWADAKRATLLLTSIDQIEARQIVRRAGGIEDDASLSAALDTWEAQFFGAAQPRFERVFENTRFRVYRVPPP